jgi:aminoglycoside phosphotransferase (APT) family kinase protein
VIDTTPEATAILEALLDRVPDGRGRRAGAVDGRRVAETWRCVVAAPRTWCNASGATRRARHAVEAAVLEAAAAAGVPVPEVVACVTDADGRRRRSSRAAVDGETIARQHPPRRRFAAARVDAHRRSSGRRSPGCTRSIPSTVPGLEHADALVTYRDRPRRARSATPHVRARVPVARRQPPTQHARIAVVHGDFRLGNVIVDEHGLAAVLDWELAHLGDPVEDLGWLCVAAWRFGSPLPVAGVGA